MNSGLIRKHLWTLTALAGCALYVAFGPDGFIKSLALGTLFALPGLMAIEHAGTGPSANKRRLWRGAGAGLVLCGILVVVATMVPR